MFDVNKMHELNSAIQKSIRWCEVKESRYFAKELIDMGVPPAVFGQLRIIAAEDIGLADPESTLVSFNRQFGLNAQEKDAVEWAWPKEQGTNMFAVVNTYTRAAQWDELSAESSFRLSRVGGNILGMLN